MRKKIIGVALCALLLAISYPAEAQQTKKVPRIGVLSPGFPGPSPLLDAFRQGLRELGHVERKNIVFEYRHAEGKIDRFADLAAELVRSKVDIMVARSYAGAQAAKNATKTIPIVMVGVGTDPVATGLVESLARPGGNITGFTNLGGELSGKRLELFKETVPKVARVAVLYEPANSANVRSVKEVESAAHALGMGLMAKKCWSIDKKVM